MSDGPALTVDLKSMWLWLQGAAFLGLAALSRWTFGRHMKTTDGHEERISTLEKTVVPRHELMQILETIRLERMQFHKENQDRMLEINDSVERVHQRIDQLWDRGQR